MPWVQVRDLTLVNKRKSRKALMSTTGLHILVHTVDIHLLTCTCAHTGEHSCTPPPPIMEIETSFLLLPEGREVKKPSFLSTEKWTQYLIYMRQLIKQQAVSPAPIVAWLLSVSLLTCWDVLLPQWLLSSASKYMLASAFQLCSSQGDGQISS